MMAQQITYKLSYSTSYVHDNRLVFTDAKPEEPKKEELIKVKIPENYTQMVVYVREKEGQAWEQLGPTGEAHSGLDANVNNFDLGPGKKTLTIHKDGEKTPDVDIVQNEDGSYTLS